METQLHTGARASIDNNSRASTKRALPLTLGILIAGFEAVGAAVANRQPLHEVDVSIVAPRAIARGDEALRTLGICDEAPCLHAKSTIDFAIFTGRPVTPCRDSVACLPSHGRPLGAMACAFASVIRSA
ncbi:hypothetical protein [Burkholderia sp. RF4-BP95]|uniref:hypothetical protein n=1 Tax=Burkholderia sp. RF4-BP95 TaxID=1637845 RepID=UPI000A78C88C|nr:hypothetical protein [Burkholderia sp. RF4-BP95]